MQQALSTSLAAPPRRLFAISIKAMVTIRARGVYKYADWSVWQLSSLAALGCPWRDAWRCQVRSVGGSQSQAGIRALTSHLSAIRG